MESIRFCSAVRLELLCIILAAFVSLNQAFGQMQGSGTGVLGLNFNQSKVLSEMSVKHENTELMPTTSDHPSSILNQNNVSVSSTVVQEDSRKSINPELFPLKNVSKRYSDSSAYIKSSLSTNGSGDLNVKTNGALSSNSMNAQSLRRPFINAASSTATVADRESLSMQTAQISFPQSVQLSYTLPSSVDLEVNIVARESMQTINIQPSHSYLHISHPETAKHLTTDISVSQNMLLQSKIEISRSTLAISKEFVPYSLEISSNAMENSPVSKDFFYSRKENTSIIDHNQIVPTTNSEMIDRTSLVESTVMTVPDSLSSSTSSPTNNTVNPSEVSVGKPRDTNELSMHTYSLVSTESSSKVSETLPRKNSYLFENFNNLSHPLMKSTPTPVFTSYFLEATQIFSAAEQSVVRNTSRELNGTTDQSSAFPYRMPRDVDSSQPVDTVAFRTNSDWTLQGPSKIFILDLSSVHETNDYQIYASAGNEETYVSSSELISPSYVTQSDVPVTPHMDIISSSSSEMSESTSATVKVPVQSSDSSVFATTSLEEVSTVRPRQPLWKIQTSYGQYFQFTVPQKFLYDARGEATDRINLTLLTEDALKFDESFWIKFDSHLQLISGIALGEDAMHKRVHHFILRATDSAEFTVKDDIISIEVDSSAIQTLNHHFIVTLNSSFSDFVSDSNNVNDLVLRIGNYFSDATLDNIIITEVSNGSVKIKWSNSTLSRDHCENNTISDLYQRLSSVHFHDSLRPYFDVRTVDLELSDVCIYPEDATNIVVYVKSDNNAWIAIVVPALTLLILILIIGLLICYVRNHRRYTGALYFDDEKPIFSKERKPVLMENEYEMTDVTQNPKRPAILNQDIDDRSDKSDTPNHNVRPPPPQYRQPSIGDDFDSVFSDTDCPSLSYEGSPSEGLPEYRLPPPYTTLVKPFFGLPGSSEA